LFLYFIPYSHIVSVLFGLFILSIGIRI